MQKIDELYKNKLTDIEENLIENCSKIKELNAQLKIDQEHSHENLSFQIKELQKQNDVLKNELRAIITSYDDVLIPIINQRPINISTEENKKTLPKPFGM